MNNIFINALRENIRNRTVYIMAILSVVLFAVILLGGGLSINGKKITSYKELIPVSLQLVNFMGCVIGIFVSMNTIPREYERKTTHLIMIRGINREKINLSLGLSNIAMSILGVVLLSVSTYVFTIISGNYSALLKITGAIFIIAINVSIISCLTSVFSMIIPASFSGFLAIIFYLAGICYSQLQLLCQVTHGIIKVFVKAILIFIPNLYSVTSQASELVNYGKADLNIVFTSILYLFVGLCIFLIRIKRDV